MNRIEVIDARLVCIDRDPEMILEERHQLERADRIENPAGDQRSLIRELVGILAGEERGKMNWRITAAISSMKASLES